MTKLPSIAAVVIAGLLAGCVTQKYGQERQLTVNNGTHPVWAIAPAVNLSGETSVDPILQADLVYHQLAAVNNITLIPVNKVVQVFAALHITRVESEEQAALVCEQLGCDGLVIPTITIYDPYNPPKMGAALQLLTRSSAPHVNNVDVRELSRMATPAENTALPYHPQFIQVVGMYDATNGSVRDAVARYAKGRFSPSSQLADNKYFLCMDSYCEFVYFTLIEQMIGRLPGQPPQPVLAARPEQPSPFGLTARSN